MPTVKISELSNLSSAVYTDVVPIVNGGVTQKIAIRNLVNSVGDITVTGTITAPFFVGDLTGNVVGTANTASYVLGSNVDGAVELANTASYVLGSNVDGAVELANTASYVENAQTASYVLGSNVDGAVGLANTASYIDYTNIDNKPTLVSGSSQITLEDATGNLTGNRIFGPVADAVDAVSASYVLASNIDQPFSILEVSGSTSTVIFSTGSLPITDPGVSGQLWRSGSIGNETYLMVSLG